MSGKPKVAIVIAKNFEDVEATDPIKALEAAGAEPVLIGIEKGTVEGKKGAKLEVDKTFDELTSEDEAEFVALIIPGGGAPENLRIHDPAVAFTKRFVESGRPVASICHGPQLLISAGVLKNRTSTAVNKIRDDLINAGANYVDEAVTIDGNLISSRTPADLPAFNEALVSAIKN
jgi:protease I